MTPRIHMIGVHGLLGGPAAKGGVGYSLGIDGMLVKARNLAPERVGFDIFEHHEDPAIYEAIVKAARAGKRVVTCGHSLGAKDAIVWPHRAGDEHGIVTSLAFVFDPTWNDPAPPVRRCIRRAINYYGKGFSLLGHDRLEPAQGFDGYLANIAVFAPHINVDDDLGAHAHFLREIAWLLDPRAGSATLPERVRSEPLATPAAWPTGRPELNP